jgi:hypothetical protein
MEEHSDTSTAIVDEPTLAHGGVSRKDRSGRRAPEEQAEIARRVVIYAEQVERTGQFTWLPHRDQGMSCED